MDAQIRNRLNQVVAKLQQVAAGSHFIDVNTDPEGGTLIVEFDSFVAHVQVNPSGVVIETVYDDDEESSSSEDISFSPHDLVCVQIEKDQREVSFTYQNPDGEEMVVFVTHDEVLVEWFDGRTQKIKFRDI